MKTDLSQSSIDSYRENGFLVIEDFLDDAELEAWRQALADALEQRGNFRLPGGQRPDDAAQSQTYGARTFIQRLNLWQSSTVMRQLLLDRRIGKIAADLEGIDGVRVWHDQALIKEPWANATTWHVDNPFFSFSSKHCTTIWIALDDVTMQNGCLYFLPATHKLASYEPAGFGLNMADLFKAYPNWATIQPVAATMTAGSCSFHNGLTAHAAGPNMTTGSRRAMTCAFMPDGATFNGKQNVLSDDQVAQLAVGDMLDDETQNPMVYSRENPRGRGMNR